MSFTIHFLVQCIFNFLLWECVCSVLQGLEILDDFMGNSVFMFLFCVFFSLDSDKM